MLGDLLHIYNDSSYSMFFVWYTAVCLYERTVLSNLKSYSYHIWYEASWMLYADKAYIICCTPRLLLCKMIF